MEEIFKWPVEEKTGLNVDITNWKPSPTIKIDAKLPAVIHCSPKTNEKISCPKIKIINTGTKIIHIKI